jgi:hypothetical protein
LLLPQLLLPLQLFPPPLLRRIRLTSSFIEEITQSSTETLLFQLLSDTLALLLCLFLLFLFLL